jgi:hypothetical protein
MYYNFKRALGMSFLLYASTFIVGILSGVLGGVDMSSMDNVPEAFWYIGMIAAVVLAALFTWRYFADTRIERSTLNGLYFGLTAIAFSMLLDLILFSLGNMQGADVDLIAYYSDVRFWTIVIIVVATASVVGYVVRTPNVQGSIDL